MHVSCRGDGMGSRPLGESWRWEAAVWKQKRGDRPGLPLLSSSHRTSPRAVVRARVLITSISSKANFPRPRDGQCRHRIEAGGWCLIASPIRDCLTSTAGWTLFRHAGTNERSSRPGAGPSLQRGGGEGRRKSVLIRVLPCILLARSSVSRMPSIFVLVLVRTPTPPQEEAKLRPILGRMSRAERSPPLGTRREH